MALVSASQALAYSEPPSGTVPPNNDVSAPVNVGGTAQTKNGAFSVGGLLKALANIQVPAAWVGADVLNVNGNQVWNSGGALYLQYSGSANSNVIVGGQAGVVQKLGVNTQAPGGTLDVENGAGTATICLNGTDAAHCTSSIAPSTNYWTLNSGNLYNNVGNYLSVVNTTGGNSLYVMPGLGAGAWNSLTQAGDTLFLWRGATVDSVTTGVVFGPWSASAKGMRIDSNGSVGIGTPTPGARLEVQITDNNFAKTLRLSNSNTGVNAQAGLQMTQGSNVGYLFQQGTGLYVWNGANGPTVFNTNNTERMRINAAGSVGIGTVSPAASSLTVDNAAHTMQLCLNGTDAAHCTASITPSANFWDYDGTSLLSNNRGNTIKFWNQTAGQGYAQVNSGNATNAGYFSWIRPNGQRLAYLGWDPTNLNLNLENGANFMVTGGNVGIGTASATNKLTVDTSAAAGTPSSYQYAANVSGATYVTLGANTTAGLVQSWYGKPLLLNSQGNSVGIGTVAPAGSSLTVDSAAHDMQICLNGTDAAHCTTSITPSTNYWTGSLTGNVSNANSGFVGIGTNAPTQLLDVRGVIRQSLNSSTDVYIQGGASTAGGSARNLALYGDITYDKLYVNYNNEYSGGTQIGGPLDVMGNIAMSGITALMRDGTNALLFPYGTGYANHDLYIGISSSAVNVITTGNAIVNGFMTIEGSDGAFGLSVPNGIYTATKIQAGGDVFAPQAKSLIIRARLQWGYTTASGVACNSQPTTFSAWQVCTAAFDEHCVAAGYVGGVSIDSDASGYDGYCFRAGAGSGGSEINI